MTSRKQGIPAKKARKTIAPKKGVKKVKAKKQVPPRAKKSPKRKAAPQIRGVITASAATQNNSWYVAPFEGKAPKPRRFARFRSAVNGLFVTTCYAVLHPWTTYRDVMQRRADKRKAR